MKYEFIFLIVFSTSIQAGEVIKKSSTGICHDTNSPYYEKTQKYTIYTTIDECLKSGGRLPNNNKTNSSLTKTDDKYSRDKFGKGWSEGQDPNDCMNTRHEILKKMSTSIIETGKNQCTVATGKWFDPYTGKTFHQARDMDIDHIVPLKWAWEHGANHWPQAKREQLANDPANLLAVQNRANRSKGAKAPWDWMPPDKSYHCQYLLRFTRVVKTYELKISNDEQNKLKGLYQKGQCRTPKDL